MGQLISHNVVKILRKRYLLALSIIGCLIIGSQILIQYSIAHQVDDSRIINLAGRQRMLSQKITKIVLEIDRTEVSEERQVYLLELDKAIALWEKSNEGLIHGDVSLNLPGENSERIINMFDGISTHYSTLLKAAKAFSSLQKETTVNEDLVDDQIQMIVQSEPGF